MICTEGRYYKDRIPVLSNVYDIPVRFKEVNRDFFIMFNTRTQKYELHDPKLPFSTLYCVLPFDELDARSIAYVLERRNICLEDLAREIERYNEELDRKQQAEMIDKANYKCREALNYLKDNTHTDSIPQEVIDE